MMMAAAILSLFVHDADNNEAGMDTIPNSDVELVGTQCIITNTKKDSLGGKRYDTTDEY